MARTAHRQEPAHAALVLKILKLLIEFDLKIKRFEEIAVLAYRLGIAQKEDASGVECIVEKGNQLFLQLRAHVDKKISAAHKIESRKGRILNNALFRKDQHVSDIFMNAIGVGLLVSRKKTCQTLR